MGLPHLKQWSHSCINDVVHVGNVNVDLLVKNCSEQQKQWALLCCVDLLFLFVQHCVALEVQINCFCTSHSLLSPARSIQTSLWFWRKLWRSQLLLQCVACQVHTYICRSKCTFGRTCWCVKMQARQWMYHHSLCGSGGQRWLGVNLTFDLCTPGTYLWHWHKRLLWVHLLWYFNTLQSFTHLPTLQQNSWDLPTDSFMRWVGTC